MKKPLYLVALAICAACDLSTGAPAGPSVPRTVDSTGHPYGVLTIQGRFLPYTYTSDVSHTVVSANLCLFTNGTYRFSELIETPSAINPDRLYEDYNTYTLSPTGKVTFNGQGQGTKGIGTDTLTFFNSLTNHSYQFGPDQTQLNQSCVRPITTP